MGKTIFENRGLVIYHSPKCACSHLKSVLIALAENKKIVGRRVHGAFRKYNHVNSPNSKFTGVTTHVLVVRDPLKRLVSGFLDKAYYVSPRAIKRNITFLDFCRHLEKHGFEMANGYRIDRVHFQPQTEGDWDIPPEALTPPSDLSTNTVLMDVSKIDYAMLKNFFPTCTTSLETLSTLNTTHNNSKYGTTQISSSYRHAYLIPWNVLRNTTTSPHYLDYYNTETLRVAHKVYAKDFELFHSWDMYQKPNHDIHK
jgi:hypothetical protein